MYLLIVRVQRSSPWQPASIHPDDVSLLYIHVPSVYIFDFCSVPIITTCTYIIMLAVVAMYMYMYNHTMYTCIIHTYMQGNVDSTP